MPDANMVEVAIALPAALEVGAVVAGACSGAMTAVAEKLDIIGVTVLALVTGLGGGLIRDIILPSADVYMLDHPLAMLLCVAVGVAAFFFAGLFYKLDKPIAVFDAVSMALFTFMGADKALMFGYNFAACVLLGCITAVGGGAARDVCLARVPRIFMTGKFYAVCALAGAIVYVGLVYLGCSKVLAASVCLVVVLGLWWASQRFNVITVTPVDLTPRITGPITSLAHKVQHADTIPFRSDYRGEASRAADVSSSSTGVSSEGDSSGANGTPV